MHFYLGARCGRLEAPANLVEVDGSSDEPLDRQPGRDELERAKTAAAAFVDASKRTFFEGWQAAVGDASFVPKDLPRGLDRAELSNALSEISYELGSRPDWVSIPLTRLERLASIQA